MIPVLVKLKVCMEHEGHCTLPTRSFYAHFVEHTDGKLNNKGFLCDTSAYARQTVLVDGCCKGLVCHEPQWAVTLDTDDGHKLVQLEEQIAARQANAAADFAAMELRHRADMTAFAKRFAGDGDSPQFHKELAEMKERHETDMYAFKHLNQQRLVIQARIITQADAMV